MKMRAWQRLTAVTLVATATSIGGAAEGDDPKPAPLTNETKPSLLVTNAPPAAPPSVTVPVTDTAPVSVIPPKLDLPPLLDQVVRLSKSGADETVIKAYLEKSAPAYRVTGNDILALQEQGVPKHVILSLLENSKAVTPAPEAVATAPMAAETNAISTIPEATAPLTPEVSDFYDALAPYGTWVTVPDYGWAWQPTVTVVNPAWRPYCDNGSWLWSDSGWYWDSYYSWGWAPFHYGRWYSHPGRGWLWCPDRVWGPSWVSWRNSPTWCGWAPLPPGACFTAGVGWSYWGVSVGSDCNFGIASSHYNFVSHHQFTDRHVGHHRAHGHDANTAYAHSRVANHYSWGENNRIFNHGVGREQIAAARGSAVPQVAVSDAMPRRSTLSPTRAIATARSQGQPAASRTSGMSGMSGGATSASIAPNNTRFAGSANNSRRATPNNMANQRAVSAPSRSLAMAAARASAPTRATYAPQTYSRASAPAARSFNATRSLASQRSYSPQRSMATARSFSAPASVQRNFSSRPTMSAPSRGGGSFAGSVSRSGGGMSAGRVSAGRR